MKRELLIRETLVVGVSYEFLFNEFILFVSKEFGTIKMNEIIKKVNSSGKVSKFLYQARQINARLNTNDFLAIIHSSFTFVFSKPETISIATIVLLKKWNFEVGDPNGLSNDVYLNKIFFSILDKCDGFKTHIKTAPNFFERFNDYLIKTFTIRTIEANEPMDKTDVTFDSILCGAITTKEKTEFRVNHNLEVVNLFPNEWKFKSNDYENGAIFLNSFLDESVLIKYPYKLGSFINVFDSSNPSKVHCEIRITSCFIQRLQEVNGTDAKREGFGAYKEKIEEMFKQDPSLDGEYYLFLENWIEEHGGTLDRNEWFWVFEFEKKDIGNFARSADLSDESIAAILAASSLF